MRISAFVSCVDIGFDFLGLDFGLYLDLSTAFKAIGVMMHYKLF